MKFAVFVVSLATLLVCVSALRRTFGICPHGFTGFCSSNSPCPDGSACNIVLTNKGFCCRDPPEECQYGEEGICGGIAGFTCPIDTTCQFTPPYPDGAGKCCRNKPVEENCKYGQAGICGGIAGFTCPKDTTCQFLPPYPDGAGKCCRSKPVEDICEHGQDGVCGGIAGIQCRKGYTCSFIPTDISDGMGKCCKDSEKMVCPPPSPLLGICIFDPSKNCLGDEYCPEGQLCCREGCGSVCKPAIKPISGQDNGDSIAY